MDVSKTLRLISAPLVLMLLTGCLSDKAWMNASGSPASVPKDSSLAFESYVRESLDNIEQVLTKVRVTGSESPYVGGYSISDTAKMRGPFQIPEQLANLCQDKVKGAGKGFLLIHGLTDSPYLLRNMADSLAAAYPCSLIRAVLLPGHGTVVGDTLDMKYQDWMKITEYGVQSFQRLQSIDQLYLVGFSTGTALAIKHLKEGLSSDKIKGLVLLSTAVKASSDFAWLTSYLKVFKSWLSEHKERDAARYSSFSTNAGSQFYQLTKGMVDKKYQVDIPVFMAVSADDATINASAARDFYCNYVNHKRKVMFWYLGFEKQPLAQCSGIVQIEKADIKQQYDGVDYRFANHAHTGISIDPGDKHYGVSGVYRDCKAYETSASDSQWASCMQDTDNRVFGEKNIASMSDVLGGGMWRRGTFNKDYQQLVQGVICFVDQSCSLEHLIEKN
ncbi:MAG: esterase [Oceanospirillaceae bacterium]|nr:esterase [Oceanospirillaceae bacterium]